MTDKQDVTRPQPEQPGFQFVPPEDGVYEVYSNIIDATWTPFDIRLRFAQILPARPAGGWIAEERAAVTIAWPEAKHLRDIMIDLVRRFEGANGEIQPLKLPE